MVLVGNICVIRNHYKAQRLIIKEFLCAPFRIGVGTMHNFHDPNDPDNVYEVDSNMEEGRQPSQRNQEIQILRRPPHPPPWTPGPSEQPAARDVPVPVFVPHPRHQLPVRDHRRDDDGPPVFDLEDYQDRVTATVQPLVDGMELIVDALQDIANEVARTREQLDRRAREQRRRTTGCCEWIRSLKLPIIVWRRRSLSDNEIVLQRSVSDDARVVR